MKLRKFLSYYFVLFGYAFVTFFLMYFFETPIISTLRFPPDEPLAIISVESIRQTYLEAEFILSPTVVENSSSPISYLNSSTVNHNSFVSIMSSFDWKGYTLTMNSGRNQQNRAEIEKIEKYQESLMLMLTQFLTIEPKVRVKTSCTAPSLTPHSGIHCQGHGNAFNGSVRTVLPKVGILVQFGFSVDVLEIYLNEMYDVVDRFFIIESTKSHYRTLRKVLIWERIKDQARFIKFADKIIHFVIDDAETAEVTELYEKSNTTEIWLMENLQENLRWKKFMKWNEAHNFFSPDDLIGFGDGDEIPSRQMVHLLKHCELNAQRVDFGIWFPFGNIKFAFASDYPVRGHKYTLGDPTFWTVRLALRYSQLTHKTPGRMRGKSEKFILGGIHMTHYGYLPYQLTRRISCTECSPYSATQVARLVRHLQNNEVRKLEVEYGAVDKSFVKRLVNIKFIAKEMEDIAILPWFYACNKNRYPVFEGGHDTRLD